MLALLDGWCSACNWHAASTLSMTICSVQDFPQKMYKDATVNATHWCWLGSNSTIRMLSLYQKTVAVHFPVQDVLGEGLPLHFQDCGKETMIMCDITLLQYFTKFFKFICLFFELLVMEQYPLWHKKLWTHSIFTLHWEWNVPSCFTPNLTNSLPYTDKIFKLCNLDEISSRTVKISAPYVLSPLTYIFNKVLSTGIFPER